VPWRICPQLKKGVWLQAADLLAIESHVQDTCTALADRVFATERREKGVLTDEEKDIIRPVLIQVLFCVLANNWVAGWKRRCMYEHF
jgi:hypothetical protein